MEGLGDVPMSQEAKAELMKRESKFAMDELLEEIEGTMGRINEAIDAYKEDPTEDTAVVQYIIMVMLFDSLHTAVVQSAKRFQRRAGVSR
jgi:hypothetical protein